MCLIPIVINAQTEQSKIDSINSLPNDIVVSNIGKNIKLFIDTIEEAKSIDYEYGEAKALSILGMLYYLNGKYDKSTEQYINAAKIFEKLHKEEDLAVLYGDFGYQLKRRDLSKANEYMRLGIKIAEKNDLKKDLTKLYDNYGVLKEMSADYDSAGYFYQKGLDLKYELSDSIGIPYSLNHLTGISALKGNYKKAFSLLALSDKYRAKEKGNYGHLENLVIYGDLYLSMGNLDSAIVKYEECTKTKEAYDQSYLIRYCYNQITKIYEQKKDYTNAYIYQKMLSEYKDSVLNYETNAKIAELQIDFETEKKDRQIAENKLELQQQTDQMIFLGGTVILLIILSLWIYRSQKLKRERLKIELELKNQLRKSEYEKKMSDEKLRISRELHDNIGSHLTFMISSLDNLVYSDKNNTASTKLKSLSRFGRETLGELRNTIWAMNLKEADLEQLFMKLINLKQQFSENGTGISLEIINNVKEQVKLSSAQNLNIYRIVQEALQNAFKHSGATYILVSFDKNDSGICLTIKDNGKGFNSEMKSSGHGLQNMKQRCEESGGVYNFNSDKNGTEITCTFPLN